MKFAKIATVFSLFFLCAASGIAMTKEETEARWKALSAAQELRAAGESQARELRARLDAEKESGTLYSLWSRMTARACPDRLKLAWSILRSPEIDGDASHWAKADYMQLPQEILRPFMVIDGLYYALTELPKREGGDWVAADLLREFARSSHGKYDFIFTCPSEVAEAVRGIVQRTGLVGLWTVREEKGRLPAAAPVRGDIPEHVARDEGMMFLDAAGLPANSGIYVWDREKGCFYNVLFEPSYRIQP